MAGRLGEDKLPLVVVVGPTASGKTALTISLAKQFDGEVISADSRAVYKDLNIGTAKPTLEEMQGVVHWGFDIIGPGERFTVADFKAFAESKITDIRSRGKIPFLVGGTGLYIDAVLYDFQFPDTNVDPDFRQQLEDMTLEGLYDFCTKHNITLPENYKNKRHVINAILRINQPPRRNNQLPDNTIVVGISTDLQILRKRIEDRSEQIFSPAMIEEARSAADEYSWDVEAMTGNIYPLMKQYLNDQIDFEQARQKFIILDWRLAKRQLTWLRRNKHITWLELDMAHTFIARKLAQLSNK